MLVKSFECLIVLYSLECYINKLEETLKDLSRNIKSSFERQYEISGQDLLTN